MSPSSSLPVTPSPSAATFIYERTFSGTKLQRLDTNNVTVIGDSAFEDCDSLSSVTIGKATSIGKWAFEDCDSLRSVTIGKAAAIGNAAFAKIGSSCTVSYNGSASAWSHLDFEFSPNLVLSDTILYISAAHGSKHSEVHTTDGTIEVAASVSALAKQYGRLFLRCHHSHLVNPDYIQNIRRFKVTLSDGTELPIPEKKYTAFREQCQKRS